MQLKNRVTNKNPTRRKKNIEKCLKKNAEKLKIEIKFMAAGECLYTTNIIQLIKHKKRKIL